MSDSRRRLPRGRRLIDTFDSYTGARLRPPPRFGADRCCAEAGCITVLAELNPGPFASGTPMSAPQSC